jgi:26S proteasome regulatory subunit N1
MAPKTAEDAASKDKAGEKDSNKKLEAKGKGKKGFEAIEEELSEEDKQLKEELELCVERLKEDDAKLYPLALENMRKLIRASTTRERTMTRDSRYCI